MSHYLPFASLLAEYDCIFLSSLIFSGNSSVILKVLTIDITQVIISSFNDNVKQIDTSDAHKSFFLLIPWRNLTNDFFEVHTNCGIYLGRVAHLFHTIVQNENTCCIEQLSVAGFYDRLLDQYLENKTGTDISAHVSLCISHLLKNNNYDWKSALTLKVDRWDHTLELANDENGVVYQFNNHSMPYIDESSKIQNPRALD